MKRLISLVLLLVAGLPVWSGTNIVSPPASTIALSATFESPCGWGPYVKPGVVSLPGINGVAGDQSPRIDLWNYFGQPDSTYSCTSSPSGGTAPAFTATNSFTAIGLTFNTTNPDSVYVPAATLIACVGCTYGVKATDHADATGVTVTGPANIAAASGGGGFVPTPIAEGTDKYFVSQSLGADTNDGLYKQASGAGHGPWKTLNRANTALAGATNQPSLFLLGGDAWSNEQLTIRWGGTVNRPVIVGSYYISNNTAYINEATNWTPSRRPSDYTYTVPRPIIQGTYRDTCRSTSVDGAPRCAYHAPNGDTPGVSVPTNLYSALVEVWAAAPVYQYITIQDLVVTDSAGIGIYDGGHTDHQCHPGWETTSCAAYVTIQRNKVGQTAGNGISVSSLSNAVIAFNEVFKDDRAGENFDNQPGGDARGSAIVPLLCEPCEILIEGNDIHDNAEGTGIYGPTVVLVRGTEEANTAGDQLDSGMSDQVVFEQNIAYSAPDTDPKGNTQSSKGPPFWTAGYECWDLSGGTLTLQNFCRRTMRRNNILLSQGKDAINYYWLYSSPASEAGKQYSMWNYGNTSIVTGTTGHALQYAFSTAPASVFGPEGINTYSNLFIAPSDAQQCNMDSVVPPVFHQGNNQWTIPLVLQPYCGGSGDVVDSNTGLPGTFNFANATWANRPAISEFTPNVSGAGVGHGLYITSQTMATDATWDWVLSKRRWLPACNTTGQQVTKTEWVKGLTTDFCGNPRANPPSIGAIEASGTPPTTTALGHTGRWFTYNGAPTYLIGVDAQELAISGQSGVGPPLTHPYLPVLDALAGYGVNKVRVWGDVYFGYNYALRPWTYNPNTGLYDLESYNAAYWNRMKQFIADCQARGIIVEISLFSDYPAETFYWGGAVFKPNWNKTYNTNGAFTTNANGMFGPEFFTTTDTGETDGAGHTMYDIQRAYIDKATTEFAAYPNVFYEMQNEAYFSQANFTNGTNVITAWLQGLLAYGDTKTTKLLGSDVGIYDWSQVASFYNRADTDVLNSHLYDQSPANISSALHSSQLKGKVLQDNESYEWYIFSSNCVNVDDNCPADTGMVDADTREMWGYFINGAHYSWYNGHRIWYTNWSMIGTRMKVMRDIINTVDIFSTSPVDGGGTEYDSIVTGGPAGANHQVMANPGQTYIVYFWGTPANTNVSITLAAGTYDYKFYDTRNGTILGSGTVSGGSATIPSPSSGAWSGAAGMALFISKTSSTSNPVTAKFVDCSLGGHGGDGSLGNPWHALGDVTGMVTSMDLLLKQGTTCTLQTLSVNWGGTANDPVIIGTYYVSGGVAFLDTPTSTPLTNPQSGLTYGNGPRAIIQGSYQASCRTYPSQCRFGIYPVNAGQTFVGANPPVPAGENNYLLTVQGNPYVIVQDLVLKDSAGGGFQMFGKGDDPTGNRDWCYAPTITPGCDDYLLVQRVQIDHSAANGVTLQGSSNFVFRDSEVLYSDLMEPDHQNNGNAAGAGAFALARCDPCNGLIENNWTHDIWGENILPFGTTHILIRMNRLSNTQKPLIYWEGGDMIAEQNILSGGAVTIEPGLGFPDQSYASPSWASLRWTHEQASTSGGWPPSRGARNIFRNNLIANYQMCLSVGEENQDAANDVYSGGVVGNTCVGPSGKKALDGSSLNLVGTITSPPGLTFADNILATDTGAPTCNVDARASVTYDYNAWVSTPADTDCRGAHDSYGTYASLNFPGSMSSSADESNFPQESWFQPTAGSRATMTAVALTTGVFTEAEWTWVLAQRQSKPACSSANVSSANWVKLAYADYCDVTRDGTWVGARKPAP